MKTGEIWIIAEQFSGKIQPVAFELLHRGLKLAKERGSRLCAVTLSKNMCDLELNQLIQHGAERVYALESDRLNNFDTVNHSAALSELIREKDPDIIIASASTYGRTLLPYVAMQVRTGLTADCTGLAIEEESGLLLQTRPAIGGNIMARIKCPFCRPQMATVRPHSSPPAPFQPDAKGEIIRISPELSEAISRTTAICPLENDGGIQEAEIIVTVGRGVKKTENLAPVRALTEALGAALGASREVVDRGWLGYQHQIGLSGKTVSPKLYIALGLSGSIQHLAGMQGAQTIVAVNTDPEAQIFKVADFGIVGNMFDIIPALIKEAGKGNLPWMK